MAKRLFFSDPIIVLIQHFSLTSTHITLSYLLEHFNERIGSFIDLLIDRVDNVSYFEYLYVVFSFCVSLILYYYFRR